MRQQEMVIGIFAIGGVFVFYGKGPFTIQITSYEFVYSFVEGQPAKDTLRKTNVTFEKTGIKTDSSIQETPGSTSQTIH